MFKQSDLNIGDIVRMKKVHPCGGKLFVIKQLGVDFKLECQTCSKLLIIPREHALKSITKIERKTKENL